MVITRDIILRGDIWRELVRNMSNIFKRRTHYELFTLCCSIGILHDKQLQFLADLQSDEPVSITRTVLNNDREVIEFMFQTAILTTATVDIEEDNRLRVAFGDEHDGYDWMGLLIGFANFGATKLVDRIGETELETADNINTYINVLKEENGLKLNLFSDDEF